MKPVAVTVSRFRGWKNQQRVSLAAPITSVQAANGIGKSSLLNAIEWCLFGAKVTTKGSGIDERQGWELRTRTDKSDDEPTTVTVELDTAHGAATVTRQRAAKAKARDPGTFKLADPDGNVLTGEQAESWLIEAGLPDWETYRRAHCFHQEAARQRVVDSGERNAVLAELLGLGDDIALRDAIKSHNPAKIFSRIDEILDDLNDEAHRALESPKQRLQKIEARAFDAGLTRDGLSEDGASALRSELVNGAADLAYLLEMQVSIPAETDEAAIREWAPSWPARARAEAPALEALGDLRREEAHLSKLLANLEIAESELKRVQSALQDEISSGGNLAAREDEVRRCAAALRDAEEALEKNNARADLLRKAKAVIESGGRDDQCPVCESEVPDLVDGLTKTIDDLRSDQFRELEQARARAEQALQIAEVALARLLGLLEAEARATQAVNECLAALRYALGVSESEDVHDVAAAARKRLETVGKRIQELEALASKRDQSLERHQTLWGRLQIVEEWLEAASNAEKSLDLSATPEWAEFNASVDGLAKFGSDLAFIGDAARRAQADRSRERADEVNETLGKYLALITQRDGDVHIDVRETGQNVAYELKDKSGNPAVPILNQAAINALSLSALFAQSEARSGAGNWSYVTLDDPVQSLDDERQKGLANAIEELANSCSVLVATIPGEFSNRLRDYVNKKRHVVTLGPWTQAEGASISSEEDL